MFLLLSTKTEKKLPEERVKLLSNTTYTHTHTHMKLLDLLSLVPFLWEKSSVIAWTFGLLIWKFHPCCRIRSTLLRKTKNNVVQTISNTKQQTAVVILIYRGTYDSSTWRKKKEKLIFKIEKFFNLGMKHNQQPFLFTSHWWELQKVFGKGDTKQVRKWWDRRYSLRTTYSGTINGLKVGLEWLDEMIEKGINRRFKKRTLAGQRNEEIIILLMLVINALYIKNI